MDWSVGGAAAAAATCAPLTLAGATGDGEMTSGVNTESESDSVPETTTEERAGFCVPEHKRQQTCTQDSRRLLGWRKAERAARYGTFTWGLTEWTESLRVTSWSDGGGTERREDMLGTVELLLGRAGRVW